MGGLTPYPIGVNFRTGQLSLPTPRCFGGRVTPAQNPAHGRQQARNAGLGQVLGPPDPLPPQPPRGQVGRGRKTVNSWGYGGAKHRRSPMNFWKQVNESAAFALMPLRPCDACQSALPKLESRGIRYGSLLTSWQVAGGPGDGG